MVLDNVVKSLVQTFLNLYHWLCVRGVGKAQPLGTPFVVIHCIWRLRIYPGLCVTGFPLVIVMRPAGTGVY